jgi:peptidoglycan-associated lipoprotein
MTLLQHGRGGWVNRGGRVARLGGLVILGLLVAAGCSSKAKGLPNEGNAGKVGTESGTGASESSLKQMQQGTLGATSGGPLTDIHFAYNAYSIEPQDGSILKQNASWLQAHPQTHVQVEGHCDERGSEEYNIALGAKRAQAAKDYLETLGVEGSRISTISYGKELPLCTEHTESCWAENRRDHFVVQQ